MARASSSGLSSALRGGAETIVARATAPGRAALAVVRLSGDAVEGVLAAVCPAVRMDRPWRAQLVVVAGRDGAAVDRAVVIPYRGPRSFTGEDMAEIVVHGAPVLVGEVLEACVAAGARLATPGEFTRRAVANGKLDLLQAEGIRDLVDADTVRQARRAQRLAGGELSRRMWVLRDRLVDLLAILEVTLDFAEDEGYGELEGRAAEARRECLGQVVEMLGSAAAGRRAADGCRVVLCGAPNSGKSTLYNRLLRRERAIVSAQPGTTRDTLETELDVHGAPVVLVDTAGLWTGGGSVEREGVRRAEEAVDEADVVVRLWAADHETAAASEPSPGSDEIRVRSKADLLPPGRTVDDGWLAVSAATGEGVETLWTRIRDRAVGGLEETGDSLTVGARQQDALERARRQLEEADVGEPELAAEHVRLALDAVGGLTGEAATEEVLDAVFGTFCLGK